LACAQLDAALQRSTARPDRHALGLLKVDAAAKRLAVAKSRRIG